MEYERAGSSHSLLRGSNPAFAADLVTSVLSPTGGSDSN